MKCSRCGREIKNINNSIAGMGKTCYRISMGLTTKPKKIKKESKNVQKLF